MSCYNCHYKFCWICGQGCSYAHYLPFNPFGCPGLLISPSKRWCILTTNILNLLFLPLVMFLTTLIFFSVAITVGIASLNEKCCGLSKYKLEQLNCICWIPVGIFFALELAIALPLAIGVSVLLVGLVIVPAYIF